MSEEEQKYAHFLSLASWHGSLICLEQTSPESPVIFTFFQRLFGAQPIVEWKARASAAGVPIEHIRRVLLYAAAFYGNMGNYLSFGDSKFIPKITAADFRACVVSTTHDASLIALCDSVLPAMYSLTPDVIELGFPDRPAGMVVRAYSI